MTDNTLEDRLRDIFSTQLSSDKPLNLEPEEFLSDPDGNGQSFLLKHPWGDNTLALMVPNEESKARELAEVLNRISLPESYSGVYHIESQTLELFWTAFKVRTKHEDLSRREFCIHWRGAQRKCKFGPASPEAMTLAKYALPIASPSHTEHRNITSFLLHAHGSDNPHLGEPLCFSIDCKNLNDEEIEEYVRTINFYMTYYDRETPRILIHEQGLKKDGSSRPRYPVGFFPSELVAEVVDSSVASFWLGAFETRDPAMKYLLHYRLLEFLTLSYLKQDQKKDLMNILRRPHLLSSTEGAAAEVISLFSNPITSNNDRMKQFLSEVVDEEIIISVLNMNKDYFEVDTTFDGGHVVKRLFKPSSTKNDWLSSGAGALVDRLRAIRNCLAHGQDEGTRGVIHNTQRNRRALMPWTNLIETIAAEAMLYSTRTYSDGGNYREHYRLTPP